MLAIPPISLLPFFQARRIARATFSAFACRPRALRPISEAKGATPMLALIEKLIARCSIFTDKNKTARPSSYDGAKAELLATLPFRPFADGK